MAWALVTPASRGIGFALTRHLLTHTNIPVIATARKDLPTVKESLLSGLDVPEDRLHVLQLDVTDEQSISTAATHAKTLTSHLPGTPHLRLAFCLPGILHPEKSPSQLTYASALSTFQVNTLGPLFVLKHFSDFLPRKSTDLGPSESARDAHDQTKGLPPFALWLTMAARVGSTSENALGGWYSYRASKAGVYSLTKTFDLFLQQRAGAKAQAVCYHPGTVQTSLSEEFWEGARRRAGLEGLEDEAGKEVKGKGLFGVEEAVEKMWGVVGGFGGEEARGRCWDWRGEEILP